MAEKVKIYSTATCHFCKQAKAYLTEKGVDFIEYDVGKDRAALKEMMRVSGGARSVPVICVCNEVMVGFDQSRLDQALNCLAQSSEV